MRRTFLVLAAFGVAVAACGGDSDSGGFGAPTATDAPADSTGSSTAPPATTSEPGSAAATSLEEVRDGVVRIVGTGTFADPADGSQVTVPGSGTGFIIDPSGIAVTNNHVVTGAALLEVYISGEEEPRNAQVLGVSECSDLAVIQIEGDGFSYLDWYDGTVAAGMDIFAVGFPLGDSEYTVLDGIISKEQANGDTSWASVDSVIEHTADTLPGSSGGPIVTADGKVVGVNYSGNDAGQSFAIGIGVGQPIVDTLATGVDVDSLGINGEAILDGSFSGIWVSSVESGSLADVAGVEPGDVLLSIEAIKLATDGTMADYCDIIRSHTPTDTLAIELYRPSVDQVLKGQINGRPLEVVSSFEAELDEVVAEGENEVAEYTEYVTITDDSELIEVNVPAEWGDVRGDSWSSGLVAGEELIGPAVSASTDLEAFNTGWDVPGVFIGASAMITTGIEETLDNYWFGDDCTYDDRYEYDDGFYTGLYDLYTNCGSAGSLFIQVIAEPADQTWIASVQIGAVTEADLAAADEIIASFRVDDLAG